jgi:hypothetical protein
VTPPGQARMLGAWTDSDLMDCWADVYDDDHGEMQACEANPDPKSALGLCSEHERQLAMAASVGRPLSLRARNRAADPVSGKRSPPPAQGQGIPANPGLTSESFF